MVGTSLTRCLVSYSALTTRKSTPGAKSKCPCSATGTSSKKSPVVETYKLFIMYYKQNIFGTCTHNINIWFGSFLLQYIGFERQIRTWYLHLKTVPHLLEWSRVIGCCFTLTPSRWRATLRKGGALEPPSGFGLGRRQTKRHSSFAGKPWTKTNKSYPRPTFWSSRKYQKLNTSLQIKRPIWSSYMSHFRRAWTFVLPVCNVNLFISGS